MSTRVVLLLMSDRIIDAGGAEVAETAGLINAGTAELAENIKGMPSTVTARIRRGTALRDLRVLRVSVLKSSPCSLALVRLTNS
jgi:hypothetical protein